jgi:UDP-2,3-diacylglucosamine pyrophosphatase LpxH
MDHGQTSIPHLGTRGCHARALLDFLETHDCDYLYLVGDIIDFWRLGRAPHWPQLHSDVIRTVLSKTRAGTVVTLIPGNHDEYLRRFCDLQLGHIMVTAEAVHRTVDGRLFLVVHGDQFDGITRTYIVPRSARSRAWSTAIPATGSRAARLWSSAATARSSSSPWLPRPPRESPPFASC